MCPYSLFTLDGVRWNFVLFCNGSIYYVYFALQKCTHWRQMYEGDRRIIIIIVLGHDCTVTGSTGLGKKSVCGDIRKYLRKCSERSLMKFSDRNSIKRKFFRQEIEYCRTMDCGYNIFLHMHCKNKGLYLNIV